MQHCYKALNFMHEHICNVAARLLSLQAQQRFKGWPFCIDLSGGCTTQTTALLNWGWCGFPVEGNGAAL